MGGVFVKSSYKVNKKTNKNGNLWGRERGRDAIQTSLCVLYLVFTLTLYKCFI